MFPELLRSTRVVSKSVLAVWLIRRGSSYTASVPAPVCVCLHMPLQVSLACRSVLNFQGTQTSFQRRLKSRHRPYVYISQRFHPLEERPQGLAAADGGVGVED